MTADDYVNLVQSAIGHPLGPGWTCRLEPISLAKYFVFHGPGWTIEVLSCNDDPWVECGSCGAYLSTDFDSTLREARCILAAMKTINKAQP